MRREMMLETKDMELTNITGGHFKKNKGNNHFHIKGNNCGNGNKKYNNNKGNENQSGRNGARSYKCRCCNTNHPGKDCDGNAVNCRFCDK